MGISWQSENLYTASCGTRVVQVLVRAAHTKKVAARASASADTGFTGRNAARMARPTTTIPMIVVTARRVSQPAVDVTSEYSRKLLRLVASGALGTYARIRKELGYAAEEPKDSYPACPDLEDRRKVAELLKPEPMIRNSSCVLTGTGRYCEMSLAQTCENLIGEFFNAAFGCHGHSGFVCFEGLECLQL